MMPSPSTPRAVTTNGKGQPCTSHLNLTRSLADVWFPKPDEPRPLAPAVMGPGPRDYTTIPYAGAER